MCGKVWLIPFVFLMLWWSQNVNAQSSSANYTNQLWLDFNPSWNIGDRQKIIADIDYRLNWPHSWNRFVVRAGYQYKSYNSLFKRLKSEEDYLAGLGFFYIIKDDGSQALEIRPYQGFKTTFFLSNRWKMRNYVRAEERFHVDLEDQTQSFGMRLRYQISTDYYVRGKIYLNGKGFYLPLAVEFFFDLVETSSANDVLRVTPGLGYQFNSDFKLQGTLGYHFTQFDKAGLNAVVYRISLYKTIF
jgi:hypothetical protein